MPDPDNTPINDDTKPSSLLGDGNFLFKDNSNNRTNASEDPPQDTPPVETPPVETPPVDTPPVDNPPVDTPPADEPPKDAPPVDTPPTDDIKPIVPDSILNPSDENNNPEDEIEVPEGLEDKAKNAFIKQRHELKEKDNVIKELNEKLKTQGDPEEVKNLKEQLQEAHDTIGKISLQDHPAFKQAYDAPRAALINKIKEAVKEAEADESIVDKAASMSLLNRSRFLSEQVPDLQNALIPYFSEIDNIDTKKAEALSNHKQTSETLRTNIETQQTQQRAALKTKVTTTALENLMGGDHFAFRKGEGEGMEEWNASVDNLINGAKEIMDSDDVLSQTQFMMAGMAVPTYLAVIKNQTEKIAKLTNDLKIQMGTNPNINVDDPPAGDDQNRDKTKGMSSSDAASRVVSNMANIKPK